MAKIMIIPIGAPRAGKSTLSKKLNITSISRDCIREELHGHKSNMTTEDTVTETYNKRLKESMEKGLDVFIDNTNLKLKYRRYFTKIAREYGYRVVYVAFFIELETLRKRAENTNFPFDVIVNMIKGMDIINLREQEDYDELIYITEKTINENPYDYVEELVGYNQNSKYHNLSLGWHMKGAEANARDKGYSEVIRVASLYHDIAKPYVKIVNEDGTWSYPGHAIPSAYQMISLMLCNEKVHVTKETVFAASLLITKHMDRFQDYGRKYVRRTLAELGRFNLVWEDLEKVWECDKAAH